MNRVRTTIAAATLAIAALSLPLGITGPSPADAQTPDPGLYEGLQWREIGPFRGGRSTAVSGVPARPEEYYMGVTGGGLWKSTNAGEDWLNVSDGFFGTGSVGGIGVSSSNPDVVYVGMGETEIRGNISHGDGVYRSTDGGETWTHVGLRDSQFISRVRVHPTNPDIAYVAALGHVYGPNEERGVFRTTNGGRSWEKILFVSDRAGAIDLSMLPGDPDILYAATWEASRTPYSLNSGGPGSKLFKSVDGGDNWTEITRNPGLPGGTIGKIGVAVSPADPNRVYAIVEAEDGGIFRSDDAGATWRLVEDHRRFRQRAWYYSRIYADTRDPDVFYVLNTGFYHFTGGGEEFRSIGVPHGDNHDLWLDPEEPSRMINANDGGANVSNDGGESWTEQDFATAQFYHVTTDNAFPYRIYGAQQDNSTVRIPSRTQGSGIRREDWTSTAGGESGYIAAKPDDPDVVFGGSYGGLLTMVNHRTNQRRNVNAWPDNPMGHGAIDSKHRFQWTFPIVFSPHDPDLLYTCSQHLLKSTNGGQTWKTISPDLTRNDPATLGPSGGEITKDNTSVEYYATIFTISESPITPGLIWAGSDDGLVHVTRDGGASWENITPPGMPEWGLCSMIEASPHDPAGAWLAVDNHENDDFTPYVYRTRDFGKSWTKIVSGITTTTFARVVREDPNKQGLLYAGTEMGVFVSFNGGDNWQSLQLNLPLAPIHDLVVKEDDVVVATHGRSFWVLDDVTPLHQIDEVSSSARLHFFKPKDAYRVTWGGSGRPGETVGQNPAQGVLFSYYLADPVDSIRFEFVDAVGDVFMTVENSERGPGSRISTEAGMHRVSFTPVYPSFRSFAGMIMWAAGPRPIAAPPGEYQVRMTAGGQTRTHSYQLMKDPRSESSDADLMAQFQMAIRIRDRVNNANDAVFMIRDIYRQIDAAVDRSDNDRRLQREGNALKTKLGVVEAEIYQVENRSSQDPLNFPIKLNNKIAALLGVVLTGDYRPTDQTYEVFADLSAQLQVQLDALGQILETDLEAYNQRLRRMNQEPIVPVDRAVDEGR
jgi:photosystem II stability/assembly factor-like uncharacterized protein